MKLLTLLPRLAAPLLIAGAAAAAGAHPGSGIVVDRRGTVYFVDTGSGVWMVDAGGKVARHDGPAFHWMAIDEHQRPAGAALPSIPQGEVRAAGVDPALLLSSDVPLVVGPDGALYYPALGSDRFLRIRRLTHAGADSVRATLPATAPGALRWINGLAAGADGALYYTEDRAVRKIDSGGTVTTLAEGFAVPDCAAIPGVEPEAGPYLRGLAVAPDGIVYVAASGCRAVLKITPRGEVTTVLRSGSPWSPTAVATSPSGLYVLEYLHAPGDDRVVWVPRVRRVLADGGIVDVAAITRPPAR